MENKIIEDKETFYIKELQARINQLCEENEELKKGLRTSNDKVSMLESERKRLIESIHKLDDQLSNKELFKSNFTNSV